MEKSHSCLNWFIYSSSLCRVHPIIIQHKCKFILFSITPMFTISINNCFKDLYNNHLNPKHLKTKFLDNPSISIWVSIFKMKTPLEN